MGRDWPYDIGLKRSHNLATPPRDEKQKKLEETITELPKLMKDMLFTSSKAKAADDDEGITESERTMAYIEDHNETKRRMHRAVLGIKTIADLICLMIVY